MTEQLDMKPRTVHAATVQKLYAALQQATGNGDPELINALSSAIQRLNYTVL